MNTPLDRQLTARRPGGAVLALILGLSLLALALVALAAPPAYAAGGAYSFDWQAADPTPNKGPYAPSYPRLYPTSSLTAGPGYVANPAPSGGVGRAEDPLRDAVSFSPLAPYASDAVESLMPADMALGQVVPFEIVLTVSGSVAPENGTIEFNGLWDTHTSSGDDFGFDPAWGVYSAFVDIADSGTTPTTLAKVDSYSYTILSPGTKKEQIKGTIRVSGLRNGDRVIVEVWMVLDRTLVTKPTGGVGSALGNASTVAPKPDTINTGNQTVSLLQVGDFFTNKADLSITKTDAPDPVVAGQNVTYTITATNNSTSNLANNVVITDTLDPNASFVSASDGGTYTDNPGTTPDTVTWSLGFLTPLQTKTVTLVVTAGANTPTENVTGFSPDTRGGTTSPANPDFLNKVAVTHMAVDDVSTNNTHYQPTNVLPLGVKIIKQDDAPGGAIDLGLDQTLRYTLVVTNQSSATTVTSVVVTDTLDPKATYSSSTPAYTTKSGQTLTWNLGSLAPGATATITVDVTLNRADWPDGKLVPNGGEDPNGINYNPLTVSNPDATFRDGADLFNYAWVTCAQESPNTFDNNGVYKTTGTLNPSGGPSLAVVGDIGAYVDGGDVVVRWQTVSEVGTAGFRLQRWNGNSWHTVGGLVPSLGTAKDSATYAVRDSQAQPGRLYTWRLQEIELGGGHNIYGPYRLTAKKDLPSGTAAKLGERASVRMLQGTTTPAAANAPAAAATRLATAATTPTRMRLEVTSAGLTRVDASAIAAAMGWTPAQTTSLIKSKSLKLTSAGGGGVAYLAASDGSSLSFFAEAPSGPYSARNAYWLAPGAGSLIATTAATRASGTAQTSFPETLSFEQDVLPATALFHDPAGDFWLWDYLVAGDAKLGAKSFAFQAPAALKGTSLSVSLQGLTASGKADEHQVEVRLNGQLLGTLLWSGATAKAGSFSLPAGALAAGANSLQLTARLASGIPYSLVALDSFSLRYERATALPGGGSLTLRPAAAGLVRIDGASTSNALIFDLASPLAPKLVKPSTSGGSGTSAWVGFVAVKDRPYLVTTAAAAQVPVALSGVGAPTLKVAGAGADYLVLTPTQFAATAAQLAAWRAGQGLTTRVVTSQEIYDEFSGGVASPLALRDFLRYAKANWKPAPRYVLLAGDGSYDYRGLTSDPSLLPPLLIDTAYGLAPSDAGLADTSGDGVPDLALGRLPVSSAAGLAAGLTKLQAYEADAGSWRSRLQLLADNPDAAGNFTADAAGLAALYPAGLETITTALGPLSKSDARSQLLSSWKTGALLATYVGHGAVGQLASEGLLTRADVPTLGNGSRLPVALLLTCVAGSFALPGQASLAETLVTETSGGAVAALAPSSLEENSDSVAYGAAVTRALFAANGGRLGDALVGGAGAYAAAGGAPAALATYSLLGDPATVVRW